MQDEGEGFVDVSRDDPCPVCGKPDWCTRTADRHIVICRRRPQGAPKLSRDGGGVYYFTLAGVQVGSFREAIADDPAYQTERVAEALPGRLHPPWRGRNRQQNRKKHAEEKPVVPQRHEEEGSASDKKRNAAYQALLDGLPLTPDHRYALEVRGLSFNEILRRQYRTIQRDGKLLARAVRAAQEAVGGDLSGVPGFYMAHPEGKKPFWWAHMRPGILIPCRNEDGLIVGAQIRADDAPREGQPKYTWLSSNGRESGTAMRSRAHLARPKVMPERKVVGITEGLLKADIAAWFTGIPWIGVAGVTQWEEALEYIPALRPGQVIVAFDADAAKNPFVAKAKEALLQRLLELAEGRALVQEATWPLQAGKGIDDVLAARQAERITLVEWSNVWTAQGAPRELPGAVPAAGLLAQSGAYLRKSKAGHAVRA